MAFLSLRLDNVANDCIGGKDHTISVLQGRTVGIVLVGWLLRPVPGIE